MALGRNEANAAVESELADEGVQPAQLGLSSRSAGAPDHDEDGIAPGLEAGERLHGDARSFQRLDAPGEQQDGPTLGKAQRPAGLGAIAGREEGVVHTRGHDLDP